MQFPKQLVVPVLLLAFCIVCVTYLRSCVDGEDYSITKEHYSLSKKALIPIDKIAILLTFYVNSKERQERYIRIIRKWLSQTDFHIFGVISSGENFFPDTHDRFHPLVFQQTNLKKGRYTAQLSVYEQDSILRAVRYFDFTPFHFVFKITGKYFIPNLEGVLSQIPADVKLVVQFRKDTAHTQNSEIVGMRTDIIQDVIAPISLRTTFEMALNQAKAFYKYHQLPKLALERNDLVARTNGEYFSYL